MDRVSIGSGQNKVKDVTSIVSRYIVSRYLPNHTFSPPLQYWSYS